ncbi:hypothetical protein BELL_1492g00010 [Botrytis elliptica]|uniref:Glc8 protein n=1 Tax=Botrytis elliptica TaxID=278938 RepID=A0A4Z1I0E0_9HELO|nr:hypothetical protein EAE99_001515 [Botrytis elliptica]TGO54806.1 hypothetical protein BELL_1492g00010 [Botrytis elliptica]
MATTMSSSEAQVLHSPPSPTVKRPKGILKNSFHRSPPFQAPITTSAPPITSPKHVAVPSTPTTSAISDHDVTLQNTLQNAGHRRSSSASRPIRRASSGSTYNSHDDSNNMRLQWDEANLYLTEQEKSSTMKINEPKTPYAKHYDPAEDADEIRTIDAGEIVVDELDKVKGGHRRNHQRDEEIPGLSLGEPEEAVPEREVEMGEGEEKKVHVAGANGRDADAEMGGMTEEEREKHEKFEAMRRKHYDMANVAGLLGHPEEVDGEEEDEEMR